MASISIPQISTPSCFSTPSQFLFESAYPCLHNSSRLLAAACLSTTCSTECPNDSDATADMSGDPSVPGAVCRIKALPGDMLLLILSYMNARHVVQTCLLSRQWRNLWRSVPHINATSDEFEHMSDDYEEYTMLFKKFVNHFLMLRNPFALDKFRLWYDMPWDSDNYSEDANLWICHALNCNARSIMVTVREYRLELDPVVFISGCVLRRLHLSSVTLFPSFFCQLGTCCKALRCLYLCDCLMFDFEIASTTLKNMESLKRACVVLDTNTEDDICQFLKSLSGITDFETSITRDDICQFLKNTLHPCLYL